MADALVGTRNFSVAEWERESSGGRTPDEFRARAQRTLETLQSFRDALGVPVIISDAWRSADDNAHTPGSARNSQHMTGDGVDFVVPSMSKRDVAATLDNAQWAGELGDYRQLIYYLTDDHYHLGTGTGQQRLVKVDSATYVPYLGADTIPDLAPLARIGSTEAGVVLVLVALVAAFLLLRKL